MPRRTSANNLTNFPHIAVQWHPTKNGDLMPEHFTSGSHTKAWWVCVRGHEWCARIKNRTLNKTGCQLCYWKFDKVRSRGCLETSHPNLALQWDYDLNVGLTPKDVCPGSNKTVWWRCQEGCDHVWKAQVYRRTGGGGCPMCNGHKVSRATSLLVQRSDIASEWHPTKNTTLQPGQVHVGSHKIVWWVCTVDTSHEWESTVKDRTGKNSGCPVCRNKMERLLFEVSCRVFDSYEVRHGARPQWLGRQHLDIYVPALNLAIERHGEQHYMPVGFFGGVKQFQKNVERDQRKRALCKENGVKLVEVRYDEPHTEEHLRQICGV